MDEAKSIFKNNKMDALNPEQDQSDFTNGVANLVDKGFLEWVEDDLQIVFTGEMFIIEIYQTAQSELTKRLFDPSLQ